MRNLKAVFGAVLVLSVALSAPAYAHSVLKGSSPAANAVVSSPSVIELRLSERVSPRFSKVTLTGPGNTAIPTGPLTAGPDGRSLITPVSASLPVGRYLVAWNVLSKDGHKVNGQYGFTVRPAQ